MRQQKWEDQVRETLNEYTSQSKGDWKAFSEKLDFESFDDKIRSTLIDHQASNYQSHWKRIQAEMLIRKQVSRKIIKVKFFELLVLVFLLQGLYIAIPFDRIPTKEKTSSSDGNSTNRAISVPLATAIINHMSTEHQGQQSHTINVTHQTKSKPQSLEIPAIKSLNYQIKSSASSSENQKAKLSNQIVISSKFVENANNNELTKGIHRSANHNVQNRDVEPIPLITSNIAYEKKNLLSGELEISSERNKKHSIGFYAGISNADVNSPYDPIYLRKGYKTNGSALRYGVDYGYILGKWMIKTGVEYLNMRYLPIPQYETPQPSLVQNEAPIKVGLSEFKYQQLSFPLSIQREYSLGGKSVLSFSAGVNPSINLYSTYLLEYKSSNETVRRVAVDNNYVNTSHLEGAGIQDKEFDTGVVYGGTWRRNLSLYSTTSIGYHHHLPMDIRMNITGYYCHPLYDFRLGPNRDKINLYGMTLGMSKYF